MIKVLITGAGGFIGRHLVADQLDRGRQVTAIDLDVQALSAMATNPNLQIVEADFSDQVTVEPLLNGHGVCIHLASAHLETGVDDHYFWDVNVDRTLAFVKQCHAAGIPTFIHCSTVGVFGDIKNPPADEDSPCQPDVAYERSKLAGELAVRQYSQETGYNVVVIRPAWVYGPGCHRTQRLFKTIKKGRFFYVGDGKTLRHPIYISDMVKGFEVAMTKENVAGEVFIMAGPRPVTISELADSIAQTLAVSPPWLKVPEIFVWPAVFALETFGKLFRQDVPFTRRSLKFFSGNTAFRSQKAIDLLGYEAQVDLAEGLQNTYRWLSEAKLI